MRAWHRVALGALAGGMVGVGSAVQQIRSGMADGTIQNGPWTTAKSYGTTDADALTRAKVALGGLLALPATEAMYFNAKVDDDGRPLDGKCTYEVSHFYFPDGGALEARWWSVTLYDPAGYLVRNPQNRYSLGSGTSFLVEAFVFGKWRIRVTPQTLPEEAYWISTGGVPRFELTLRTYHPRAALLADPGHVPLPSIKRLECA
jgi:hypothetical protein